MLPFFILRLYNLIFWISTPYWRFFLSRRIKRGKEDSKRFLEKTGKTNLPQRKEKIIWINAVSVGETLAVMPLIERLLETYPSINVLLTTSTKTAAEIAESQLPRRAFHQFIVIDHPLYVRRFLNHWQPIMAIWVESELWPNLISQTAKRAIPMALVNAKFSLNSFRSWSRVRWLSSFLLSKFNICLAQSEENKEFLTLLGAKQVIVGGNLKYDAKPLSCDEAQKNLWQNVLGESKVFLAASTHEGEDEAIVKAHLDICALGKNIKTFIAPRHPQRARKVAALALPLKTQFYSAHQPLSKETDIYIIDAIGVLGLFYRLADIVFMGGSLVAHGGQNPLEPARLDCALLSGAHVHNFQSLYALLQQKGGAKFVDSNTLSQNLRDLLDNPQKINAMARQAKEVSNNLKGALEGTLTELKKIMKEQDVAAS